MNLVPRKKNLREYYSDIDQWEYVADILDLAGVDYSDMRFTNEGYFVPAGTAKRWSRAIKAYVREDAELKIPDASHKSKYRARPVGANRDKYDSFKKEVFSVKSAGLSDDLGLLSGSPQEFFSDKSSENQFYHGGEITKLNPRRRKDLLSFARWLDKCGGFYQW